MNAYLIFKIEGNPAPTDFIKTLLQSAPEIVIFNGYAGIFMPEMLEVGCAGIMPGCSFIEIYALIYELFKEGKKDEMYQFHRSLCQYILPWMSDCEYMIQIEKRILQKRGIIGTDTCRSPSYRLSEQDFLTIQKFLTEYRYLC